MVRRRRTRTRRAPDSGLTLVELMVTIIIAGLVTSSTFLFFAGQKQVYETQTRVLNVQQNLWASLEAITRNVRAAGTGMVGCVRPDSDGVGPDTGDPPPGGNAPPQTGLRAFLDGNIIRIAPIWVQNGINGAPDTLTVAYGTGASGNFSDAQLNSIMPAGQPTAPIETLPNLSAVFRPNEFIVLSYNVLNPPSGNLDRGCTLFQITGIDAAADRLAHASTSDWNAPGNEGAPFQLVPWQYDDTNTGIRNFGQLTWVQFAIDDTGPVPMLTMERMDGDQGPQILAEGVEDLQVAYACDTLPVAAPDGVLTEGIDNASRLLDEWTFNTAGDIPNVACNRPQAVRITLIARSRTQDDTLMNIPGNAKPAAEDGAPGAPDRFRHRLITTTVFPRN